MASSFILPVLLLILLGAAYFGYLYLFEYNHLVERGFQTLFVLAVAYFVQMVLARVVVRTIKMAKERYFIAKVAKYIVYIIAVITVFALWIDQAQNVIIALSVIGAGVAIAMQRPLMSFVGFIAIITQKVYSAGDRVQIGEDFGDVIDIDLFYTKLMEMGNWIGNDQPTGRIKTVPNSFVLEKTVNNYTKDFPFIWDEIMVPVTYGSDWKKARKVMEGAARKVTKGLVEKSKPKLARLSLKYLFERKDVEPFVYVVPTDNWLELRVRFIVDAKHRRRYVNALYEDIVEEFGKSKKIRISSKTTARVWDTPRKRGY